MWISKDQYYKNMARAVLKGYFAGLGEAKLAEKGEKRGCCAPNKGYNKTELQRAGNKPAQGNLIRQLLDKGAAILFGRRPK
jgi:hypothetical protein